MKLIQKLKELLNKKTENSKQEEEKITLGINVNDLIETKSDSVQELDKHFSEMRECFDILNEGTEKTPIETPSIEPIKTTRELINDLMTCEDETICANLLDKVMDELTKKDVRNIMEYHSCIETQIRVLNEKNDEFPFVIAIAEDSYRDELNHAAKEYRERFVAQSKELSDEELKAAITEFNVEDCSEWTEDHRSKKDKGKNYAYCTAMCAMAGCEYQHRYFNTEREALESAYVEEMCGHEINCRDTCPTCYAEYIRECI